MPTAATPRPLPHPPLPHRNAAPRFNPRRVNLPALRHPKVMQLRNACGGIVTFAPAQGGERTLQKIESTYNLDYEGRANAIRPARTLSPAPDEPDAL
jgi:hypothetical protein